MNKMITENFMLKRKKQPPVKWINHEFKVNR